MMKPANIPVEDFVKLVAEIGFSAFEIWEWDEDLSQLAALAKQQGLALSIMSGHDGIAHGLNDPSQHARIEAELRVSIDLAARFGVPGVICFSGERRQGQSEAEAIAATVEGFRRIAPYAEAKGVNLNLELLNSKIDHPGYQCDHTAWGLEVCRQVNSPRVKLLFDIYHMQIMEGDIIRTIQGAVPWIGHFHTAGVPGRFDIDDSQELNYAAVCRAIAGTDYDLYLAHEFKPKGDLATALRTAFKICDQV
jgi:hydroxypyruvate isomerase